MEPSPTYYKAKRTLLLFVAALLLATFAGFKFLNVEQRISVLPFQLERPELLGSILLVVVAFYMFQTALHWAAQSSDVQDNKFYLIDFRFTFAVAIFSVILFLISKFFPNVTPILGQFDNAVASGTLLTAAFLVWLVLGKPDRALAKFGRIIKAESISDNKKTAALVLSQPWVLHFDPARASARKTITFDPDGSIGNGRNKNEYRWRVKEGQLEILNNQGAVFSRFSYDPKKQIFTHTNDPDTLSIRFQTIAPRQ